MRFFLAVLLVVVTCSYSALAFQRFSFSGSRTSISSYTSSSTLSAKSFSSDRSYDPLNLAAAEDSSSKTTKINNNLALTAAVAALLVPTQDAWAKGGEYGLLEGRTASLMHPVTMFALFGTSIYSANLGLKYREFRTIGERIKEAQKGYPVLSTGSAKYPVSDIITSTKASIEAIGDGDASSLQKDLQLLMGSGVAEVDRSVGDLVTRRKELSSLNLRDKHYTSGSILLGVGISLTILGCMNTYMRAGKLFPGPHLFAGAAVCGLWAIASACVPEMQKGNEAARVAHIGLNFLNVALFAWQVSTGIPIVLKVLEFTKWP